MAGYSNRSLRDKLGLKDGMRSAILRAPAGVLADIDSKSQASKRLAAGTYDFIHAFFQDQASLDSSFSSLKEHLAPTGMIWISWRKKSADPTGDLNENVVRAIGLAHGLVDVKVCAVDETWSGLKFVYRKADRPEK